MFRQRVFSYLLPLAVLLAACGPIGPAAEAPQASPAPAGEWTVRFTQSGGFAGVMLAVQVSSDGRLVAEDQRAGRTVTKTVSPETTAQIERYFTQLAKITPAAPRSGCADCFLYTLEFTSAERAARIEADDITLSASGAADLVRLLQRLREEALRSGS